MRNRFLASMNVIALVGAMSWLAGQPAEAQSPAALRKPDAGSAKPWAPPKTPDGQPDLQGIWNNSTMTPLERPKALGTKESFTEQEAAEYEQRMRQALST